MFSRHRRPHFASHPPEFGVEKLEMATQELRFVCVPHRSEQELGEAGCLPVGGLFRSF